MRKRYFIAALIVALAAAPWASAQLGVLPSHFTNWLGQPSPDWTESLEYESLWKETGHTPGEFSEYTSGDARIEVILEKYRDPSSAYEADTALIRPEMHPSMLDRTSAVDGDRLFVLLGTSMLNRRSTPVTSPEDFVAMVIAGNA